MENIFSEEIVVALNFKNVHKTIYSIAVLAMLFGFNSIAGAYSMSEAAILERIQPVGQVNIAGEATPAASNSSASTPAAADGGSIYQSACFACHGTGAAGAPIFADKAAWAPRIKQGLDTLFSHAIGGFKGMPPKGGQVQLSDDDIKAAVKHMVDGSK